MAYKQNVPVPYLPLTLVWNDRRDPHANPLSTSPRRSTPRPTDSSSKLTGLLHFIYNPGKSRG